MKIVQSNREVRHELGSRVRIREGKQRTNRDLANSAQPPPPPSRKAGSGREEVEGDEEAEEERAHGDGATAATWKPMTCGVGGDEASSGRPRLTSGWAATTTARGRCGNSSAAQRTTAGRQEAAGPTR